MKKLITLIIVCCLLSTMLASCSIIDMICGILTPEPPHTEHIDADGDGKCDGCGTDVAKPEPPHTDHTDADGDGKCDECGADVAKPEPPHTDHTDADGDGKCDGCGADVAKPEPPHTDHTDADGDGKCDGCGTDVELPNVPEYEDVRYYINISGLETGKAEEDLINGPFTIIAGTEIRNRTKKFEDPTTGDITTFTKSVKLGSSSSQIKVKVNGEGSLFFVIQNGSSGANTQKVRITSSKGETWELEFDGANNSSPLVRLEIPVSEGEYTITRVSGTIDIYELELLCKVEKSEECGFELVSTGKVDYLVSEELDLSGIRLNAVFANGKTEPLDLSKVTIDTSMVLPTAAGPYPVTIRYKDYDPITFEVFFYLPQEIKLGFDAVEKLPTNSAAGNGVYFNYSFKELYLLGESFDSKGLTVSVLARCTSTLSKEFVIDNYTITGFDSNSTGAKTLTVKYLGTSLGDLTKTLTVYVTDSLPANNLHVRVDCNYSGVIGAENDGYKIFATIQQALDFLATAPADSEKVIEIAPGTYNEKLEITIPNLTIKAADGAMDEVVIQWDSLYGEKDASGFDHVTDSTATVAVRESAYNCTIKNITIANYWSSKSIFDAEFGEGNHNEHRALALLVQSDRFVMNGGKLIGYQDTVEFFTGRQFLYNVYICGTTDFIFGTNNTTLFMQCTIHSVTSGKTDGGYITAFKGCNKGDDDAIKYGAIFYGCYFTADEDVIANANTAIGRCWGKYAAVALVKCQIDGHVSTKGSTGASKNERYVSMNAKPTDSTVQFLEYSNCGDGAILEPVAGMAMIPDSEIDNYINTDVIFGTQNGKLTYSEAWQINIFSYTH